MKNIECISAFNQIVFFLSGTIDISFIDPVTVGRYVFNLVNDFVSGIARFVQDSLCVFLDGILDILKGDAWPLTHLRFPLKNPNSSFSFPLFIRCPAGCWV